MVGQWEWYLKIRISEKVKRKNWQASGNLKIPCSTFLNGDRRIGILQRLGTSTMIALHNLLSRNLRFRKLSPQKPIILSSFGCQCLRCFRNSTSSRNYTTLTKSIKISRNCPHFLLPKNAVWASEKKKKNEEDKSEACNNNAVQLTDSGVILLKNEGRRKEEVSRRVKGVIGKFSGQRLPLWNSMHVRVISPTVASRNVAILLDFFSFQESTAVTNRVRVARFQKKIDTIDGDYTRQRPTANHLPLALSRMQSVMHRCILCSIDCNRWHTGCVLCYWSMI